MDKKTETLHKLCEALMEELEDYSKKIEKEDGMSAGDLEAVDKLSHALKSIKTTIVMMEAGDEYESHSERYMPFYGGAYNDGSYASDGRGGNRGNMGGNSYAGRRNARRDNMGRYSRDGGYSYAEDEMHGIIEDIRGMMDDLPDEKRRKVERLVSELER